MLLESLYAPTLKDRRGGLNQRRIQEYGTVTGGASALVVTFPTVPGDVIRLVQGASIYASSAGTGVIVRVSFELAQNGSVRWKVGNVPNPAIAATVQYIYNWLDIGLFIFSGDIPQAVVNYTTPNAGDNIEAMYWGYEIPRGNLNA